MIISGMPSSGKTTAARAIAKKFDLKLLGGGDMLKEIALEKGYNPKGDDWWDADEGMRFLAERKNNAEFDLEVDRRLIKNIVLGGVVVTSYTVPWICKKGLKIWFVASQQTRARRLAGRDKIEVKRALEIVKTRDLRNKRLYSKLYGIKFGEDLSVFNYLVDTNKLTADEVAAVSCKLVAINFRKGRI